MRFFIIAIIIFYSSLNNAEVTKIIVWESLYKNPTPILMDYLYRALELTKEEYGDFELVVSVEMEQGRSVIEISKLKNSKLDISSYASTKEREELAIPIRIPMLSGLLGYRICLIKEGNQALFDGITNKQQLIDKNIIIGQHQDWPDTTILRANSVPVQTAHKKSLLFQKLIRGRFDCFSRAASEIYAEYLNYRSQGIDIEKDLLIYYPSPIFFFVNKSRPLLAERLQLGLERLIASGEFDTIFYQNFSSIMIDLNLAERNIIELNNPTLSEEAIEVMRVPVQKFRDDYLKESKIITDFLND